MEKNEGGSADVGKAANLTAFLKEFVYEVKALCGGQHLLRPTVTVTLVGCMLAKTSPESESRSTSDASTEAMDTPGELRRECWSGVSVRRHHRFGVNTLGRTRLGIPQ